MTGPFFQASVSVVALIAGGVWMVWAGSVDPVPASQTAAIFSPVDDCGRCNLLALPSMLDGEPGHPNTARAQAFAAGFVPWQGRCEGVVARCLESASVAATNLPQAAGCEPESTSRAAVFVRLQALAADTMQAAAQCKTLACPGFDCSQATRLGQGLADVQVALATDRDDIEARHRRLGVLFTEAWQNASADLRRLTEWGLSGGVGDRPGRRRDELMARMRGHEAGFFDLATRFPEASAGSVLEPPLATQRSDALGQAIGQVTGVLGALEAATPGVDKAAGAADTDGLPARGDPAHEDWRRLGDAVGRALVAGITRDAELKSRLRVSAVRAAQCLDTDKQERQSVLAVLSKSRAAFETCLEHLSCPVPASRAEATDNDRKAREGRAADPAKLASLAQDLDGALDALMLGSGQTVALGLDDEVYRAGEAMIVSLTGAERCLAAGARLRLEDADGGPPPGEAWHFARARPILGGGARSGAFLLEAPPTPGHYVVGLFGDDQGRVALAQAPVRVLEGPIGCAGLSGTWQTDHGFLVTSVRDRRLRGSYRDKDGADPGFIIGEVEGRIFEGHWYGPNGQGGVRLVLSEDGRGFVGTWSENADAVSGSGRWTGRCADEGS